MGATPGQARGYAQRIVDHLVARGWSGQPINVTAPSGRVYTIEQDPVPGSPIYLVCEGIGLNVVANMRPFFRPSSKRHYDSVMEGFVSEHVAVAQAIGAQWQEIEGARDIADAAAGLDW